MELYAPIVLFTFNRLEETKRTVEALKKNYLANKTELIIFSDAACKRSDIGKVEAVRDYLKTIKGFKSVLVNESLHNKGLAKSIIEGVSEVFTNSDKVIVLEDDLITSPNFLDFMNQALDHYQDSKKVFSISGYTMNLPSLEGYPKDFFLGYRASSWGWGTWKENWEKVDWKVSDYSDFRLNPLQQLKFMKGGSDLPRMLRRQMNNEIDSWAIRWCYDQFKRKMYTVFPSSSKVISIGFGENATHTKDTVRFDTFLDKSNQRSFSFDDTIEIDKILVSEFRKKFSYKNRLFETFFK
ncbi:MAG: glycosyltransferase [Balneola sp.]|nr:glycosyltransferase [Balneola sp.]